MQITITTKTLENADACDEAIETFKKQFGESITAKWTKDKQIELLKTPIGKYIGWAYWNELLPWWSMQSADLRYADLRSADLQYANLQSADLRYANLQSANLQSANLRYANLRYANLQSANLQSANLRSASPNSLYAELFQSFGWSIGPNGLLQKEKVCQPT